jgi:hypothetical protein
VMTDIRPFWLVLRKLLNIAAWVGGTAPSRVRVNKSGCATTKETGLGGEASYGYESCGYEKIIRPDEYCG